MDLLMVIVPFREWKKKWDDTFKKFSACFFIQSDFRLKNKNTLSKYCITKIFTIVSQPNMTQNVTNMLKNKH